MLDDKKEPLKEVKEEKKVFSKKTKKYTVLKTITLEKVYNLGSTIEVEAGGKLEKELLTNKFINKHGISRSN